MIRNDPYNVGINYMYDEDGHVDCEGLEASAVFAHLYNTAKPYEQMEKIYKGEDISIEVAQEFLDNWGYRFDFINAREFLIDFTHYPILNTFGYDSKQGGVGTMARLIDELRESGKINTNISHITLIDDVMDNIQLSSMIQNLAKSDKVYFVAPFCDELVEYRQWYIFNYS